LPTDGTWRGSLPTEAGEFAYGDKLAWYRVHPIHSERDEPLTISGKRLDGRDPSFTEIEGSFLAGDHDIAMIVGGINIPLFGCWQMTGHYKDQELSFTVWVTGLAQESQLSSAPAGARHRVLVDGEGQAKSLVYQVAPEVSPNGSGMVVLHAVIDTGGKPRELQYLSGPTALTRAAIDAVKWWRYRVAIVDEEAVEVDTTIEVVFPPSNN
jgi:hypothetical protein